ncbi:MAG: DNA polymerase III subunit gamma/tau [Bacteroidota bacterium]
MSNFIVSARKYRPSRFQDVVGQEHVTQTLKNALQNDHLAHAFLFCGPRGVGKTTCARILAKVLNCQNVTDDFEPCNTCDSCKAFNENASFNITELDAASNNSVEHIRALIEQVRFPPQQGQYKVFIIDEVHMLSQQAFNAFLKTLEEPPAYAIFILATTEKHKIIPTILSRCQIFDFRRIQVPRMVAHLEDICKEENIQAEADALHIIAQKADGALRDALSIFDRIVSFSNDQIRYEDVIANLNVLDYDYYFQLIEELLIENVSGVMLLFDQIIRNGFEPDIFILGLAEHLRNILVCKDTATLQLLEVSDTLRTRYQIQAQHAPTSFLLTTLNLANDCDVNYKMARNKRLHVEMILIKMAYVNRAVRFVRPGAPISSSVGTTEQQVIEKKKPSVIITSSDAKANASDRVVASPPKPATVELPSESLTVPDVVAEPQAPLVQKPSLRRRISKHDIPDLSDLGRLTQEVKDQQRQEATQSQERPPLEQKVIREVWDKYAATARESARAMLKNTELLVSPNQEQEEGIIAKVGTQLAQKIIQQERDLIQELRNVFQRPRLRVQVQIDETKTPPEIEPKKRKLTPKEKLTKMVGENPLVRDLYERFDLAVDE